MPVLRPLVLVPLAACALLAAGCGGGSPSVANVASTTAATTTTTTPGASGLVAFSRCMRANGLPGFPDPQRYAGGNVKLTIHGYGPDNPQVARALRACGALLPSGPGGSQETAQQLRARIAAELSLARCMRGRGLARFPDPNAQGELSVAMVQAQGIDVHSPQVLRVVQACLPASHGWLTAAKVRAAIANAGH